MSNSKVEEMVLGPDRAYQIALELLEQSTDVKERTVLMSQLSGRVLDDTKRVYVIRNFANGRDVYCSGDMSCENINDVNQLILQNLEDRRKQLIQLRDQPL
jgi:uncharacterized protein YeeX (DUF496 family)